MGVSYNSSIVTSGLVMYVDAANYQSKSYNLLSNPENLSGLISLRAGAVITSNSGIAPDSTLTADLITGSASGFGYYFPTWPVGNATHSWFLKPNIDTTTFTFNHVGTGTGGTFNFSTGQFSSLVNYTGSYEIFTNNWYLVKFHTTAESNNYYVELSFNSNNGAYIWGAQLTSSSYYKTYVPQNSGFTSITDNNQWADLSRNGNNGTLTNSPTYSGANGGSLVFNGTNNYVNCGNSASLNITGSITVDAWVYFTSLTNSGDLSLVSKYSNAGGATNQAWLIWKATADYRTYGPGGAGGPNTNEFAFIATSAGNFSGGVIGTGQQVVVNTWYNVVGVYISSSDTMQLYVNGVLMKSAVRTGQTAGVLATGSRNVLIGGTVEDNNRWVQGNIPAVKIYNRALAAAEIQQNFNALRGRFGI